MLYYPSIESKAIIRKADPDNPSEFIQMKDLLSQTVQPLLGTHGSEFAWDSLFLNAKILVVPEEYIARPDLISQAMYKTDEFADLICKLNGIQNPFELNEDMILIIPSQASLESILTCGMGTVGVPSEMLKPEELSNPDNIVSSNPNSKLKPKMKNERRSPAEATVDDTNFTINKDLGLVFY